MALHEQCVGATDEWYTPAHIFTAMGGHRRRRTAGRRRHQPDDGQLRARPVASILFLDVDGVLNCEASWNSEMLDPDCCRRLLGLLDRTKAKVVLSSSWRGVPGLEERLEGRGVMAHVIGRTPRLGGPTRVRGDEIANWLRRHPAEMGDDGRWAIVDDDSDMLPEQMPRFVQTDFMNGGLQDEHCDRLAALLTD